MAAGWLSCRAPCPAAGNLQRYDDMYKLVLEPRFPELLEEGQREETSFEKSISAHMRTLPALPARARAALVRTCAPPRAARRRAVTHPPTSANHQPIRRWSFPKCSCCRGAGT